jgi:tetratricopeptide (TPR) repeat protein
MAKKHILQLIVVTFVIIVTFAVLFFIPRVPSEANNTLSEETSGEKGKLAEALSHIQYGGEPMKGITILKEIVEENPNNAEAHWYLGHFSIESGQYDKAVMRFNKVVEIDDKTYSDAYFYLGKTYATLDSIDLAIESFKKYKSLVEDTVIINGVNRFINELETLK